jgi:hypothetical protein
VIALVDYDNIVDLEKTRGPIHIVSRVVDVLGPALAGESDIRFRFYGGWFDGSVLSRRAQHIAPILHANFPRTVTSPHSPTGSVIARAELALALEVDPGKYLTHTFRDRALPHNVRCATLPFVGCSTPGACPIASSHSLIRDAKCPELGCGVQLAAILTRPEQKLVDTMLTVDLLHFSRSATEALAVVSTDDDVWPGIQAALLGGARVVHVHPVPGRSTPPHYLSFVRGRYSQCSF